MQIGRYSVRALVTDDFRLDGGAMFGAVPKALWQKRISADAENRIPLVTRVLILEDGQHTAIVDLGMGNKWSEKERGIYAIQAREQRPLQDLFPRVTHLIPTHLHFDHCGGVSEIIQGQSQLCFPNAEIILQRAHWEHAQNPNLRERASYLPANIEPIRSANLRLVEDGDEVLPDVRVFRADGHTPGMQWLVVQGAGQSLAFPSDVVPTAHHLPLPYAMGYDLCAQRSMQEKAAFLDQAIGQNWLVVFAHDRDCEAARFKRDEKGQAIIAEQLTL